jgi:hypothetical protein
VQSEAQEETMIEQRAAGAVETPRPGRLDPVSTWRRTFAEAIDTVRLSNLTVSGSPAWGGGDPVNGQNCCLSHSPLLVSLYSRNILR